MLFLQNWIVDDFCTTSYYFFNTSNFAVTLWNREWKDSSLSQDSIGDPIWRFKWGTKSVNFFGGEKLKVHFYIHELPLFKQMNDWKDPTPQRPKQEDLLWTLLWHFCLKVDLPQVACWFFVWIKWISFIHVCGTYFHTCKQVKGRCKNWWTAWNKRNVSLAGNQFFALKKIHLHWVGFFDHILTSVSFAVCSFLSHAQCGDHVCKYYWHQ